MKIKVIRANEPFNLEKPVNEYITEQERKSNKIKDIQYMQAMCMDGTSEFFAYLTIEEAGYEK